MYKNNHDYSINNNEKFYCLLTEDGEDRLQETKEAVLFFSSHFQDHDNGLNITSRQLSAIFSMISRNIDYVLSDMFYPGGLLSKADITNNSD